MNLAVASEYIYIEKSCFLTFCDLSRPQHGEGCACFSNVCCSLQKGLMSEVKNGEQTQRNPTASSLLISVKAGKKRTDLLQ